MPTLAPTETPTEVPTAVPTATPTPVPSASPTLQPTKPMRVVEFTVAVVVEEALTESQQTEACGVIKTVTSTELGVEERYVTCNLEEAGRRRRLLAVSYSATIGVSIPETDEPTSKSVVVALSQAIEESTELEDLGVLAEILSFTEEGEPEISILPSAGSKAVPSSVAVFCALALVLNQP